MGALSKKGNHLSDRPAKQKLSCRKRIIFTLLAVFIVWLISDTFAYVGLGYLGKTKHVFFRIRPATSDDQISRWYDGSPFHARWGWDIPQARQGQFGNRNGREYEYKKLYTIKVFGDSFAYGADMKDTETFEYLIEERTGWECLNYGVVGYGTDQALLKYADNGIKTKYTILCIMDENIERCLGDCSGLLDPWSAKKPKPRFWIMPDGSIALLENPVKSLSELHKLKEISFLESLRQHDYWSKYYEELNAPSELRWPATSTFVQHLDYFFYTAAKRAKLAVLPTYERHVSRWPHNHLYEVGSEGLRIMRYIVDEFVATAAARDEIPIIVIFPKRETLKIVQQYRKKPYQSLTTFLETKGYNFIDFGDVFGERDSSSNYTATAHYSLARNEVVAKELIRYIEHLQKQSETN